MTWSARNSHVRDEMVDSGCLLVIEATSHANATITIVRMAVARFESIPLHADFSEDCSQSSEKSRE